MEQVPEEGVVLALRLVPSGQSGVGGRVQSEYDGALHEHVLRSERGRPRDGQPPEHDLQAGPYGCDADRPPHRRRVTYCEKKRSGKKVTKTENNTKFSDEDACLAAVADPKAGRRVPHRGKRWAGRRPPQHLCRAAETPPEVRDPHCRRPHDPGYRAKEKTILHGHRGCKYKLAKASNAITPTEHGVYFQTDTGMCRYPKQYCDRMGLRHVGDTPQGDCKPFPGQSVMEAVFGMGVTRGAIRMFGGGFGKTPHCRSASGRRWFEIGTEEPSKGTDLLKDESDAFRRIADALGSRDPSMGPTPTSWEFSAEQVEAFFVNGVDPLDVRYRMNGNDGYLLATDGKYYAPERGEHGRGMSCYEPCGEGRHVTSAGGFLCGKCPPGRTTVGSHAGTTVGLENLSMRALLTSQTRLRVCVIQTAPMVWYPQQRNDDPIRRSHALSHVCQDSRAYPPHWERSLQQEPPSLLPRFGSQRIDVDQTI